MNNNTFSIKKFLILVTILAVPGFLYYLLQEKGKNRYKPLPIHGPKEVASTFHSVRGKKIPDTIYHKVDAFELFNQDGRSVKYPSDSNRLTVVNFFYTNCPTFCHNMMKEMARAVNTFRKNNFVSFLSITVDPNTDTPNRLKAYRNKNGWSFNNWELLTGDQSKIVALAKTSFLVDAVVDPENKTIIHSPFLILLDAEGRIRGYYDSNSKEQVDRLVDEVKVLITEELRKVKDR